MQRQGIVRKTLKPFGLTDGDISEFVDFIDAGRSVSSAKDRRKAAERVQGMRRDLIDKYGEENFLKMANAVYAKLDTLKPARSH